VNVVHLFPYSARKLGGHTNAICSFIACQRAKQINAVGIAPKPDPGAAETNWEFPLVEVEAIPNLRWADLAEQFGIAPGNSLLHFHSVTRRYAPLLADLRRAGVPYVLTSHGQLTFQNAWRWLSKFVYLHCVNRSPLNAAGLHLLTRFAAQRVGFLLPAYRGLKLIQGNLVAVPNLAELPAVSRSDYAIPPEAFVLLYLGRLDVWVKGLDFLVEAFSCLPAPRCHLVLVGPDWQAGKASLVQMANQLGCGARVHFIEPVYGLKKWSLLRLADAFVSPSRWEAFSIAQAEAMAIGLPVVTSTQVNLASDLREADAALLTPLAVEPLAKAMATLEADGERRHALGNRGRAWAELNCGADRAGARFLEFYQAILEQAHGAGD
jgi:glycosyltransferase involved in cell wall biosynthesis